MVAAFLLHWTVVFLMCVAMTIRFNLGKKNLNFNYKMKVFAWGQVEVRMLDVQTQERTLPPLFQIDDPKKQPLHPSMHSSIYSSPIVAHRSVVHN